MPKVHRAPPGTDMTVTRPVVMDVIRQLMKKTGINLNTANILYPNELGQAIQPGSTVTHGEDDQKFPGTERVSVEVTENSYQNGTLAMAVMRSEQPFIFRDDRLNVWMRPAMSQTEVEIAFRYRAENKTQAQQWRDEMRVRMASGAPQLMHDVTYSWHIPPEYIPLLQEIHRLRELVAPYNENWETFFTNNLSQRVKKVVSQSGTGGSDLAVAETQMGIVGMFDFDTEPSKGEGSESNPTWTISFSYKFNYDKPVSCILNYPLMVHNQLLGKAFRPSVDDQPYHHGKHQKRWPKSLEALDATSTTAKLLSISNGISLPAFDEFIPASVPNNSLRIMTAMCQIDTTLDDVKYLMCLDEQLSHDFILHEDIRAYLKAEYEFANKQNLSAFLISLYLNENLQGPYIDPDTRVQSPALHMDEDLNIFMTNTPNLRQMHHVRLGLIDDFTRMPQAAQDRLREHGRAFRLMLQALGEKIMPAFVGTTGQYVSRQEYRAAMDRLNAADLNRGNREGYIFNLVQYLGVVAVSRN